MHNTTQAHTHTRTYTLKQRHTLFFFSTHRHTQKDTIRRENSPIVRERVNVAKGYKHDSLTSSNKIILNNSFVKNKNTNNNNNK